MSIGAVLDGLRAEFPDVTISKIRFLESEGLVAPRRTASGYRQFSAADVSRLRFVLAAQRDQYLPLKVIKDQLDAMDRGLRSSGVTALPPAVGAVSFEGSGPDAADGPGTTHGLGAARGPGAAAPRPVSPADRPPDGLPTAADLAPSTERRLTREEFLAESGITAAVLAELEQAGLVRPGAAGFYDSDAVQVARTVRALAGFGLEPRHLRPFRAAADREVGLVAQVAAPLARQRDPDARERADETVRELAALTVRLHTLLVKAGLRALPRR
ncbi:MAG TPA: MerR family transcriptional regulator [Pseudonocardiaceae bacterium]